MLRQVQQGLLKNWVLALQPHSRPRMLLGAHKGTTSWASSVGSGQVLTYVFLYLSLLPTLKAEKGHRRAV